MQNTLFYVFPRPHRMIVGFVFFCDILAALRLIIVAHLLFVPPHNLFLHFLLVVKTPGGSVGAPTAGIVGTPGIIIRTPGSVVGTPGGIVGMPQSRHHQDATSRGIIGTPQLETSLGHVEASSLFSGSLLACTDGSRSFSQVNCSFLLFFSFHCHTDKLIVVLFVLPPFLCFYSPLHSQFLFYPTSVTSWNLSSFFWGH